MVLSVEVLESTGGSEQASQFRMELKSSGEGSGPFRTDWSMDLGAGLAGKRPTFSQAKEIATGAGLDARNRTTESTSLI